MHKQDHATEVTLRHYHKRSEQTDRQVGGIFPEPYSRENIVTDAAVEGTVNLPVRVEHDISPCVEERS